MLAWEKSFQAVRRRVGKACLVGLPCLSIAGRCSHLVAFCWVEEREDRRRQLHSPCSEESRSRVIACWSLRGFFCFFHLHTETSSPLANALFSTSELSRYQIRYADIQDSASSNTANTLDSLEVRDHGQSSTHTTVDSRPCTCRSNFIHKCAGTNH
jgi:hypothetical protein